jgi:autotransporter-associated beta strand protein
VGAANGANGAAGAGGVGIVGGNLTVLNEGAISGGMSGDGLTQADALDFTGGANALTTNGGTLSGDIEVDSGATLTLNQTAADLATGSASYSNVISGAGSLIVQADPGNSVTFSGANTFSGGTTLSGGELVVGNNQALGSGTLAMSVGTELSFVAGDSFNIGNGIKISGDPTFAPPIGTVQTLSGVISDGSSPGVVDMVGPGTLVLAAVNTFSGGTTLSGGVLQVTNNSSLGTR